MRFGLVRWIGLILGLFYVVNGVWPLVSPRSFYDQLATYPPYNEHFLHDIGAFSIGLGVGILTAIWSRDGLLAALGGVAAASVLHAYSHFIDTDLGGRSSDPYLLSLFALVAVVGVVIRLRRREA
jgi:uncharacterized protein YjeT (DUF2065 family)